MYIKQVENKNIQLVYINSLKNKTNIEGSYFVFHKLTIRVMFRITSNSKNNFK